MQLNQILDFYKQFRDGGYDSGIAGAIGEIYAIEKLGMIKAPRGTPGFDGWIDGRKVSVKTKEPKVAHRTLSQQFAPVKTHLLGMADDLLVVSIADDLTITHMIAPFNALPGRTHASGNTRFHLHDIKKYMQAHVYTEL